MSLLYNYGRLEINKKNVNDVNLLEIDNLTLDWDKLVPVHKALKNVALRLGSIGPCHISSLQVPMFIRYRYLREPVP